MPLFGAASAIAGSEGGANAAPVFTSTSTLSFLESTATFETLLDIQANDGDGGAADVGITYSIVGGSAQAYFTIDEDDGELRLNDIGRETLDYESGVTAYSLEVQADDGQSSNNTSRQTIATTLLDRTAVYQVIVYSGTNAAEGNGGDREMVFAIVRSGDQVGENSVRATASGAGAYPADAADFSNVGTLPGSIDVPFTTQSNAKSLTLDIVGDSLWEPDERLVVSLSDPDGNNTIDPGFASAEAVILNDDSATVTLGVSRNAAELFSESGAFSVDLGQANTGDDLTVTYSVAGSASPGFDYDALAGSLVIPSGDSIALIEVEGIVDDSEIEDDETIELTLTGTSVVGIGVNATPASVILVDDDWDADGDGIDDVVTDELRELFGFEPSEMAPLDDLLGGETPQTGTLSLWFRLRDLARVPMCLFGVDENASYESHCLEFTAAGDVQVTRYAVRTADSPEPVSGTDICQTQGIETTDGLVFASLTKDGGAFDLGFNGEPFCTFTAATDTQTFVVGMDTGENIAAELALMPLGGDPGDTRPVLSQSTELLSQQEIADLMLVTEPDLPDADKDGIDKANDNCPEYYNPAQADTDQNGIGDRCDTGILDGLIFDATLSGSADPDVILVAEHNRMVQAGAGDDRIRSSKGRKFLHGGSGADVYIYDDLTQRGDILRDFEQGQDRIDLSDLLAAVGYDGDDPVGDGFIGFRPRGAGCYLMFDLDGNAGSARQTYLLYVQTLGCTALNRPEHFAF
jgi:hypothetical protein